MTFLVYFGIKCGVLLQNSTAAISGHRIFLFMYRIIAILIISFNSSFASELNIIMPMDLVLFELKGKVPGLISAETKSMYSHIGIAVEVEPSNHTHRKILLAEAYPDKVQFKTLAQATFERQNALKVSIYRHKVLEQLYRTNFDAFVQMNDNIVRDFMLNYLNNPYDNTFQWNNKDKNGKAKTYCSELIYKLMNPHVRLNVTPKPMSYSKNTQKWNDYFKGKVPRGETGVSPEDFASSSMFRKVGDIILAH